MSGPISRHDISHVAKVIFHHGETVKHFVTMRAFEYQMLESTLILEWHSSDNYSFTRTDTTGMHFDMYSVSSDEEDGSATWSAKFFLLFADNDPEWKNKESYKQAVEEWKPMVGQSRFNSNLDFMLFSSLFCPDNILNFSVRGDVTVFGNQARMASMFITDNRERILGF